jgi:hypothetical protein
VELGFARAHGSPPVRATDTHDLRVSNGRWRTFAARLANVKTVVLIALFTALAGWGDARGFIHASKVWQDGSFVWMEALKCTAGFQFGMLMYWLALWRLCGSGIVAVEIQTLFWFVATIVGVALLSGRVLAWPFVDQAVAVCVLTGMGWLLYRGMEKGA